MNGLERGPGDSSGLPSFEELDLTLRLRMRGVSALSRESPLEP
jgi:hypothetical protein